MTWQVEQRRPATSVVEAGLDAFGNVENAARSRCVRTEFLRVNLDGLAAGKKCDFEFLRAGLYLTSSMYGLLPPMWSPILIATSSNLAKQGRSMLRPYKEISDLG